MNPLVPPPKLARRPAAFKSCKVKHNLDFNGSSRERKDDFHIQEWNKWHDEPFTDEMLKAEDKTVPQFASCGGCRYMTVDPLPDV